MDVLLTQSIGEGVHNGGLSRSYGTNNHESVTHDRGLIKLDDLNEPILDLREVVLLDQSSNSTLYFFVDFLWNVVLFWEDISQERQEEWNILSNELGKVHISQGSCHDHLLISSDWLRSLGVTSSSEYGKNVSKSEIIMSLLGELLLTKEVKHIELEGEGNIGLITYRGQLNHDNDLSVWHHHCHTSEEYLKVLWKLLSTSITWVHCDEISAGLDQNNWELLIWEHESLEIKLLSSSDRLDLGGDNGKSSERDSVELIEATPKSGLADSLEDLGHISELMLIRAVSDDDENTEGSSKILDGLCLTSSGWTSWGSTEKHVKSLGKGNVASIGKWCDTKSLLGSEELIGVGELDISDID
jgi:hypothetical protein